MAAGRSDHVQAHQRRLWRGKKWVLQNSGIAKTNLMGSPIFRSANSETKTERERERERERRNRRPKEREREEPAAVAGFVWNQGEFFFI